MSLFGKEISQLDRDELRDRIYGTTPEDVGKALSNGQTGQPLSLESLIFLASPAAEEFLEEMALKAKAITARRFGKTVQIYAPLYVSNHCSNSCVYCGFNARNRVPRRTLSLDEVMKEGRALSGRGIHQLLLVTGECPCEVSPGFLAEIARMLKPMFPSIAVEVYPMDEEDYRSLFKSGVDGLTIYQETYDPDAYLKVHPAGPKRDQEYRLGAPERGGAAGFRQLGIGALLGLDDWRLEACYLAMHARFLMRHWWRSQVSVSFPRLRPAAGGYQPPRPVSDRELAQMICALRLALPDAGLVLSTRESPEFRDGMAGIGVTRMSAGSRTSPGGYLDKLGNNLDKLDSNLDKFGNNLDEQGQPAEEQFSVHDGRTVAEVASALRARGFDPVWKDWDKGFEPQS